MARDDSTLEPKELIKERIPKVKLLSRQQSQSMQNVSESQCDDKQELLLKLLSRFDPDMCIKEIDVRLHSCQIALELLEQQKLLVQELHASLKDQRLKAGVLKVKEKELMDLKFYNQFPDDHKLAVKLLDFYSTNVKLLQSEDKRTKGFYSLVRESRYLSAQFVDLNSNEVHGNKAKLFLKLANAFEMKEGFVKVSDAVKLWGCNWNFAAQLTKSKFVFTPVELRSKFLRSFRRFRRCDANLRSLGRRFLTLTLTSRS